MKSNIFSCLLFFVLATSPAFSQEGYVTEKTADGNLKKRYDKALEYARSNDFERALRELDKVIEAEPRFIDALIIQGAVYDEQKQYARAEASFEQAAKIDPGYEPRIWYRLALTEINQDKYGEAREHLERFLAADPQSEKLRQQAEERLGQVKVIAELMSNPVPFEPESLGASINTQESEYLPSFTADGSFLVFTGRVNGQEDFFISENIDGVWQKGEPMEDINTPLNEGAQTISADGRLLVFTACNRRDGYGGCDLYYAEYRDGRWTPPVNMGEPVNSAAWESQPSLSASGQALYFASNRQGTRGGRDIWVSYRQPGGAWGNPQNLGSPVNTGQDDEAPFIHPDDRTLYFMSKGHPGMGGYDLFFVRRNDGGEWQEVKNLGYPINTKGNEGALVVSLDGRTGYFASDRIGSAQKSQTTEYRTTDLYRFELYPEARPDPVTYVKAVVRDAETGDLLAARVEFVDLSGSREHSSANTGADGSFLVCLPLGKDYALNVSRSGYLFHSENFALSDKSSLDDPFLLEIDLNRIPEKTVATESEKPKPVILRNVFFETGSADLKPASKTELDRLKELLEENPQLRIQINGHTDNVGGEEDNQQLSEARAKAVYDYLIANGISAGRLRYKGFGETRPIAGNETEEGRSQNRRTEFEAF